MRKYILAVDQGTTGTTVLLLNRRGRIVRRAYSEFRQIYPRPGWVEHDPEEIWRVTAKLIRSVAPAREVEAIGITNQRETAVLWDRRSGRPIHNAIVWQCRRTASLCQKMRDRGLEPEVRKKTGLVLDAYFSGTKIQWLLDNVPGARARARAGRLAFGTIDTWLIWKLTGEHVTDPTNASRTMLYDINRKAWSSEMLRILRVPASILPEVRGSSARFGDAKLAPVHGVAGDQQAALYGQLCHKPGTLKNTYGTGCFLLANTGHKRPRSKNLLATLACGPHGESVYALEGSVFIAGAAVQWLRDELKILGHARDSERIAKSIPDTGGVYLVPAFVGLGAPYWDMEARGTITGLTRGAGRAQIVRAALESIAYQTRDVVEATGLRIRELRVDGGAVANNFLMQFQADILGARILRPASIETTSLGAAYLAGIGSGFWSPSDLRRQAKIERVFKPKMSRKDREALYAGWKRAVTRAR